jgi:CHRD domain
MNRSRIVARTIAALLFGTLGASATADSKGDHGRNLKAELKGFEEIPTLSTPGNGEFRAKISGDGDSVEYKLSYDNLEGEVTQAHIHLGAKAFNGGIMVFLCSNLTDPAPPPGTQPCPVPSGTVEGSFTAEDVIGPEGQGISAGEFEEAIRALRAGATYANVHSTTRTGGEIRGQIHKDD